jgi:hypothetical protein
MLPPTEPGGKWRPIPDPGWQTHRTLDEVRAAALHEAVQFTISQLAPAEQDPVGVVLAVAERFLAWLAGPEAE